MRRLWIKYFVLFCILSLGVCTSAYAAPHITRGKTEPASSVGKHLSDRMKAKTFAPMLANATTGTVKVLFLKVDFPPDTDPATTGDGTWTDPAYANSGNSDYWINKDKTGFENYYNEVSFGQLVLQVDIFPSAPGTAYRLSNPMASYGNESGTALINLISESITKADTDIDFSQYQAVLIVHAGPGEETDTAPSANGCSANSGNSCDDLWSLYWSQSTPIVNADGKTFSEAIIMPQTGTQDNSTVDPLGIYVHEFGHWLGLPDLYDTSGFDRWDGIGKWGLMGDGMYNEGSDGIPGSSPSHPDAWCKKYLGWVTPQGFSAPDDPGTINIAHIEASGNSNQVLKLQASTTTSTQYFLVENRQQTGFDYGLPGNGLLVWLIDDSVMNANIANNTVNNNPLRPGVKLIEADNDNALGKIETECYNGLPGCDYGSSGDLFPGLTGNVSLTPYTNPSSAPYTGSAWLYLKDIASSGSGINMTVGFAPISPSGLAVSHNSTTVLTWTANAEADLARYNVYRNSIFLAETTQNQFTDSTSNNGDKYTVTAVDSNGYESAMSESATVTFASSGSDGGGCFIATAAFGSYEAPYVKILREFRDTHLLTNIIGKFTVELYYKVSPPIADFIRESEVLRFLVRIILLPAIAIAAFIMKAAFFQKYIVFGILALWLTYVVLILFMTPTISRSED